MAFRAGKEFYSIGQVGRFQGGNDYIRTAFTASPYASKNAAGGCNFPPFSSLPSYWEERAGSVGPLRIAHVGPCLMRGGTEQWLIGLTRFLNPRRCHVVRCVATCSELVDPAVVADLRLPVEVGQGPSIQNAARNCDILLSWGLPLTQLLGDVRAKVSVYIAHGDTHWVRETLEQSAGAIDHVVAVSQKVRESICHGFPTTTIANGIDAARLAKTRDAATMRESLNFHADDFILGYVGRFSAEKQPHVLIEAAARLPKRFKVLFVGWGGLEADLMRLANEKIPGRFAFARASDYLGDYYQVMNAFCLVSAYEGFSLVMLEAMMSGLPVIAAPVGAVPEFILDRVNGMIIPAEAESLATAAAMLCDNPEWARGLATAGRTRAERNGHCLRMAREYEDLFDRLLRAKQTS